MPALAGILSLDGAAPSAEFVFPLDAAFVAAEPVELKIIFKPIVGLAITEALVQPTARNSVQIAAVSLETEKGSIRENNK